MITQTAVVTESVGEIAHVQVMRESSCGQCSVQKGCGTNVFSKVLGNKFSRLAALNQIEAEKGDVVILGLRESVLLKSAFLMYMFPLVMMFSGAIAIIFLNNWFEIRLGQGWIILSSFAGLLLAFLYIRKLGHRNENDSQYQPVILRKATLSEIRTSSFPVEVS